MTSNIEATETTPAPAAKEPKSPKKACAGARRAHVAPKKGKPGKKAAPAKKGARAKEPAKTAKAAQNPKQTAAGARAGSKTAQVLELLKRPGGASAKELLKITGWQAHSLRGFLSGTVGKKMGLTVLSDKSEEGERVYSIEG
ncbi:MAG TPA: DUF3489 domain-containing protein [Candidatus Sulfotelmatobacter sp.]